MSTNRAIPNPSTIPAVTTLTATDAIVTVDTNGFTNKIDVNSLATALGQLNEAANVAAPAAMTQAAITGGEDPTEAEFNALRTDVSNLRTTVANLLVALKAVDLMVAD